MSKHPTKAKLTSVLEVSSFDADLLRYFDDRMRDPVEVEDSDNSIVKDSSDATDESYVIDCKNDSINVAKFPSIVDESITENNLNDDNSQDSVNESENSEEYYIKNFDLNPSKNECNNNEVDYSFNNSVNDEDFDEVDSVGSLESFSEDKDPIIDSRFQSYLRFYIADILNADLSRCEGDDSESKRGIIRINNCYLFKLTICGIIEHVFTGDKLYRYLKFVKYQRF